MVTSLRVFAPAFCISTTFLFSAIAAADDAYVFDRKVPKVMVHGATGTPCTNSAWAPITAGTVDLVASTLTLTGSAIVPLTTCTPKYYALSQDRPATVLTRTTAGGPFVAPPVTDDSNRARPIELPYVIVVKFHILNVGVLDDLEREAYRKQIATYIADAESIFSTNGVGVLFGVNQTINEELDVANVQAAIDLASDVNDGAPPGPLFTLLTALSPKSYDPGQLNVYVFDGGQLTNATVDTASTFRAFFVPNGMQGVWDDFIVINRAGTSTTSFAHEIGHALSLDHVDFRDAQNKLWCYVYNPAAYDGQCDYKSNNLMWVDGIAERNYLTAPQVLRAVFNQNSFINRAGRLGRKPPSTFDCPDGAMSPTCPFLGALQ
jgi:hypothetical protein